LADIPAELNLDYPEGPVDADFELLSSLIEKKNYKNSLSEEKSLKNLGKNNLN
tara:strand:- start:701 stop:859 length:159 start_codon:yes stop_codon:yes gene_type:complete